MSTRAEVVGDSAEQDQKPLRVLGCQVGSCYEYLGLAVARLARVRLCNSTAAERS